MTTPQPLTPTRAVFYGFGAWVGRLDAPTVCAWWPDEPGNLAFDPGQLVTVALARNPAAYLRGAIALEELEVDDVPDDGGLTKLGPTWPTGSTINSIWLEATFYDNLPNKPAFPQPFMSCHGYELTSVVYSRWEFGDGTVVSNQAYASHSWASTGDYPVVLRAYNESNPGGVTATVTVHVVEQPVHYVNVANLTPAPPYTTWATAATNIQDAIEAGTLPGRLVLVTNGVYRTGAVSTDGWSTNRVALTNAVVVRSVNGPSVTTIDGGGSVRCVSLAASAILSGFTLTNGYSSRGGGVWCASASAVLTNCVLTGNLALFGGGAYGGSLYNCTLIANLTFGGQEREALFLGQSFQPGP